MNISKIKNKLTHNKIINTVKKNCKYDLQIKTLTYFLQQIGVDCNNFINHTNTQEIIISKFYNIDYCDEENLGIKYEDGKYICEIDINVFTVDLYIEEPDPIYKYNMQIYKEYKNYKLAVKKFFQLIKENVK